MVRKVRVRVDQPERNPAFTTYKLGTWPHLLSSLGLSFLIFKVAKDRKITDPCRAVRRIKGGHQCEGLSTGCGTG